jgi:acetyltransferase-like isoleucine patch superfamily enzyme
MRKILYSKIVRVLLYSFFRLFYDQKYLKGYFFTTKRLGWYWCFRSIFNRTIGSNRNIPWPVNPQTIISNKSKILFDIDDLQIFQTPGCYWQNHDARIIVGKGCYIAPNVGIITTNHDIRDVSKHVEGKDVVLGEKCWIGMNSVILPGVNLGKNTVVAAGAVVTKSFLEGNCIIGGVPAKLLKIIEIEN